MKSKRFHLIVAIAAIFGALGANPVSANEISSGFEAQVRLPAGEVGVASFQGTNALYVPATPYGYVGYKLPGGVSFGLGLAFDYFKVNPPSGQTGTGWTLMLAPTIQLPFMRSEQFELFGVGRFIVTPGNVTVPLTAAQLAGAPAGATGTSSTTLVTYGGNLGLGGTWYANSHFGFGAEAGLGVNYLTLTSTPTIGGNSLAGLNTNSLYFQTYFALTASYVM